MRVRNGHDGWKVEGTASQVARQPSARAVLLLVFVRAPRAGAVKTRLAAALGDAAALRIYRRLAEHTLTQARALADEAAVRVLFTPADAGPETRAWLGDGVEYRPQGDGDLGARLEHAFAAAFAEGWPRVAVIGSDLPALSAGLLRRALAALRAHDAVLGPARDGGYYLLGLRRPAPHAFHGIAWSTERVLAQTLARLRSAGIEPFLLEMLADVDEAADLVIGDW